MGRVSTAREAPQSPQKRRNPALEQFKREKGRSRNACDRCKQKKVKVYSSISSLISTYSCCGQCDGEGLQTCSICQEGDFHCNYAQKALNEKSQYRKGCELATGVNPLLLTGPQLCRDGRRSQRVLQGWPPSAVRSLSRRRCVCRAASEVHPPGPTPYSSRDREILWRAIGRQAARGWRRAHPRVSRGGRSPHPRATGRVGSSPVH